jgi:hypothetical protein
LLFSAKPALLEDTFLQTARRLTVAALPLQTAVFYAFIFTIAFWGYKSLWKDAPFQEPDSPSYIRVADDLSDFRLDHLNMRPPGYPLLLVLTRSSQKPTRTLFYVSLALHFAAIWLLAAVLYRLGITTLWLNVFGLLLLLPPYVEFAAYVLTENLSEFLLVLGFSSLVFWFVRPASMRFLLISAVAIAYSGLTRPTYQALALVITCFLLLACKLLGSTPVSYRHIVKVTLLLPVGSILFIGGYSLLNYLQFNYFGIYPMGPRELSTRTVKVIERLPDEYAKAREALIKARDADLIKHNGEHTAYNSFRSAIPELAKITGLKEGPELSKYMLHLNLLLIKKAPLNYLQEVFIGFSTYWLPSASKLANMNSRGFQVLWAVIQLGVIAVFALQLVVILGSASFMLSQRVFVDTAKLRAEDSLRSEYVFAYALAGTIVFYNAFITSLVAIGTPRYRVPTEPLIIFMCFLGVYLWRHLIVTNKRALK